METFDIYEIACEYGLQVIETTTSSNGYPTCLHKALIGFSNFVEAENLSQKYGLRITTFFKKDGWSLWVRNNNTTYHALHITSDDYGDDYKHLYCSDRMRFYEDEVSPFIGNFNSLDELEGFVRDKRCLYDKLDNIDDSQLIITCQGKYFDTIDINSMDWSFDTRNFAIGVIKD